MIFVAIIPILWAGAAAASHSFDGWPRLQLGDTVLIGKHLQHSNLDFFGGYSFLIICRSPPHFSVLGIPFAEPPVGRLPRPKLSLSPLRSFNATSYGLRCLQPVGHPPLFTI